MKRIFAALGWDLRRIEDGTYLVRRRAKFVTRTQIVTTIALELIRESPETAARIAEEHARRAVMKVARVLKDATGAYVIP